MRERLARVLGELRHPRRPLLLTVGLVLGFTLMLAGQLRPPDPESRLPERYRLAALIERQQLDTARHKSQVELLRKQLEQERLRGSSQQAGLSEGARSISQASIQAGLVPVTGPGFTVTLDDSTLADSPTGNVNDLVIHSQDVQAVVNSMWSAGAEAVSINGQRVVSTSAILCVGNTLLLNGTVYAPPYEISAIGANRANFNSNELIRRLKTDTERYSLGFSVGRDQKLNIPAYSGSTKPLYAKPIAEKQ